MLDEASDIFERLGLVLRLSRGRPDDANRPGELCIVSVDRFAPDRPILGAAVIPWSREGTALSDVLEERRMVFRRLTDFEKVWEQESESTLKLLEACNDATLDQAVGPEGRTLPAI